MTAVSLATQPKTLTFDKYSNVKYTHRHFVEFTQRTVQPVTKFLQATQE